MNPYLKVTSHDFKTHFSRYIRLLDSGAYAGIIVKQYKRPVAIILSYTVVGDPAKKSRPA